MNHPDEELIDNIKNHQKTTESLKTLVDRHSGIYVDIVSRYVPKDSTYCDRDEILDDKDFNIYNAALKYNPDRGAKFSTFLGNETKWVCLNAYNKAKKKPLITKPPQDLDFIEEDESGDTIDNVLLQEIYSLIENHPDPRVATIFRLRYQEGEGNKELPWKLVAPHVSLSIQGCINVHDNEINSLKRKLKDKNH